MLSFLWNLLKYVIDNKTSSENETDEINNVVSYIENAYEKENQKDEYHDKSIECYKTGKITYVANDYVVVNNFYVCDAIDIHVANLKVGDTVYFLAPQDDTGKKIKINKVISVKNDTWDDAAKDQTNVSSSQTITECIIGKVINRKERILILEPQNISVDLNKVKSNFIPINGDWLILFYEVKPNESSDLDEKIPDITKIQALRCKLDVGTVSSYDPINEVGVIGKDTMFSKVVCDHGYIPVVGDKVISDNIESDQGICTWRSLTVVPLLQANSVCEINQNKNIIEKESNLSILPQSLSIKKSLRKLTANKCGIMISDNTNIDLNIQEEKDIIITVENVGNVQQVLWKGRFMIKKAYSQLTLMQPVDPNAVSILHPLHKLTYTFKCTAKFIGKSEELFIFNFKGFKIVRVFNITVKPKTIANKLYYKNNCTRTNICYMPDSNERNQETYIPGISPCRSPKFINVRSTIFKVPKHYWDIVLHGISEGKSPIEIEYEVGNSIPCLLNRLCFESYKDRFHALLYLEEIAQTTNIQQYVMESTIMKHCGSYLCMEVPGLAKRRPSLVVGDRAVVSFKWDNSEGKLKYEGFIHKIINSEIFLKFNRKFHKIYNNEDCTATFKCSNSTIQRCHNAIDIAVQNLGPNFLFPTHVVEKEAQLDLECEDDEINDKPIYKRLNEPRTNSMSSKSSCISNNSNSTISNSTTKSSTKLPVVQRLFNVKPIEQNVEPPKESVAIKSNNNSNKTEKTSSVEKISVNEKLLQASKKTSNSFSNTVIRSIISQVKKRKLFWFNKDLNYHQKEAVKNILKGQARPLPYVIFGPPGTGKTVTLCETILQIISIVPESRLLVATPSNSSADLIAERLLDSGILKPGDMVRLIAHHCLGSDSIPKKLLPYCATAKIANETTIEKPKRNGLGPKLNCTMSVFGRHKITIGTCVALGALYNMGFPRGHFTHVLVDEAGQLVEPEIMIPLSFIHQDYGQVILAGDPHQLGPVIQSRIAKSFGLDQSFLSRLLRHFPYQRDPCGFAIQYDPRLITKLTLNYRSLPEIVELSSSLFYDSELIAQISPKNSKEAKILEKLNGVILEREGASPAIVFHGVNGENCKDNDSPSWYNLEEATQAYLYLLKLYECGITPDDIGIITPYQKQVSQIHELLMDLDMELPKISSVEGFQGQERNIIIISTVRSSSNYVIDDIKHSLGFVACPRRLNVAITRARALIIILGNPKLLAQDPYWRSILIYCINRHSYTGCSFDLSEMDAFEMDSYDPFNNVELNN